MSVDLAVGGRRVYGHLERLYRLCSFYDGKRKPLEARARLCDRDLDRVFRADASAPSHILFDLTYSGVEVGGSEVYTPDRLESSFCYLLMIEGIRSIVVMNQITGSELLDWCLDVRNYLKAGSKDQDDLAFYLWKSNYANIRVRLYSALTGGESLSLGTADAGPQQSQLLSQTSQKGGQEGPVHTQGGDDSSSWHLRDKLWQLPEGVFQGNRLNVSLQEWESSSLRSLRQNLADAAYHEGSSSILNFKQAELVQIQEELDTFDQAHVDFNLLNQEIELVKSSSASRSVTEFVSEELKRLIQEILRIFRPALLTFLLKKLNSESSALFQKLREAFSELLTKSLEVEKNQSSLAQALCHRDRAPRAVELIQLLRPTAWEKFFFFLSTYQQPEANAKFFQVILKQGGKLEDLLFKWGPGAVELALDALPYFEWPQRSRFLQKCLTLQSEPKVIEAAIRELPQVSLNEREFKKFFQSLNSHFQSQVLHVLSRSALSEPWKRVLFRLTESRWMFEFSEPVFLQWMALVREKFGDVIWKSFLPLIQDRVMGVVPRYPRERKLLLTFAAEITDPQMNPDLKRVFQEEATLLFQSGELKRKLKERYR